VTLDTTGQITAGPTRLQRWLFGTVDVARSLARVPPVEVFDAGPI
jgi:hypothetical protein